MVYLLYVMCEACVALHVDDNFQKTPLQVDTFRFSPPWKIIIQIFISESIVKKLKNIWRYFKILILQNTSCLLRLIFK